MAIKARDWSTFEVQISAGSGSSSAYRKCGLKRRSALPKYCARYAPMISDKVSGGVKLSMLSLPNRPERIR